MKWLSNEELHKWLEEHGIAYDSKHRLWANATSAFSIKTPETYQDIIDLVRIIGSIDRRLSSDRIIWVTLWSLWDDPISTLLMKGLYGMVQSQELISTSFGIEGKGDFVGTDAMLALCLMASWDCYMVPDHGQFYLRSTHHGYLLIIARPNNSGELFNETITLIKKRWNIVPIPPAEAEPSVGKGG